MSTYDTSTRVPGAGAHRRAAPGPADGSLCRLPVVASKDAHQRLVHEHAAEFDVMHVHFGFDALSPQSLT